MKFLEYLTLMIHRYKENSFSTENFQERNNVSNKDMKENGKVNIDNLIKKVIVEKRKEKQKGLIAFSVFLLGVTSLLLVNF
tara:strand:+ start:208 stop:450 length:243 start_codon:yes stop_codon:yes gene_type:complete